MPITGPILATWFIAALATAGVIVRPFRFPEAIWAVAGALLLVLSGLLPIREALHAIAKGNDVYLFLAGMMLLSEVARREGLFDWVASVAVRAARGSSARLFLIAYGVGVIVTAILSNDATAVVLTPALFAATKRARVDPLPFLFTCAMVANAASFLLPISNPANLVVYDGHVPPLFDWLSRFLVPSLLAIVATFLALRWAERARLGAPVVLTDPPPRLSDGGKLAIASIILAAIALPTVSALGISLGLPTAILGAATALTVLVARRESPRLLVKDAAWSILPLVAGLFVLVAGLAHTGVIAKLSRGLGAPAVHSAHGTAAAAGGLIAVATNFMNNLPAGLVASSAVAGTHIPRVVVDAILIGVDLGPNLSVSGSLATILWLSVIRREGQDVDFWRFLKVGAVVMPPALVLALAARIFLGG